MENLRIWDADEETLLRHFCLEDECKEIIEWFKNRGLTRPDFFDERLELAERLKKLGNDKFEDSDYVNSMKSALSALYCLDFSQARATLLNDRQKRELNEAVVPIFSNLSFVFLKMKDAYNSARAADLGLSYLKKYPSPETTAMNAKMLFRRGLARAMKKDFEDARTDLVEAARLLPNDREIRNSLEKCKEAIHNQRASNTAFKDIFKKETVKNTTPGTKGWCGCSRRKQLAAAAMIRKFRKKVSYKFLFFLFLGPLWISMLNSLQPKK